MGSSKCQVRPGQARRCQTVDDPCLDIPGLAKPKEKKDWILTTNTPHSN